MKPIRVTTEYSGCGYLTAGKVYETFELDNALLHIVDDDGSTIGISVDMVLNCKVISELLARKLNKEPYACAHLGDIGLWNIVEDNQP